MEKTYVLQHPTEAKPATFLKISLRVASIALIASLPASVISALIYRFPFFMVGSMHGLEVALHTPLMWAIWIALGGFLLFLLLGFIAGFGITFYTKDNVSRKKYATWYGILIGVVSVFIFASADLIFGTW